MHTLKHTITAAGKTHVGLVRKRNEDAYGIDLERRAIFVADGMGGHPAGDVAGRIAAESAIAALGQLEESDSLRRLPVTIQNALNAHADQHPGETDLGTTFTLLRLLDDNRLELVHIGDSRAYALHDGELRPLSNDHSLVGDLVREGKLTREQARVHPRSNVITQCLCGDGRILRHVDFQYGVRQIRPGTRLLVCTDGLTDLIPESRLGEILGSTGDLTRVVDRLVEAALDAGGRDNITVVAADIN